MWEEHQRGHVYSSMHPHACSCQIALGGAGAVPCLEAPNQCNIAALRYVYVATCGVGDHALSGEMGTATVAAAAAAKRCKMQPCELVIDNIINRLLIRTN